MKKIIRLTESDLVRLVKRVIKEQGPSSNTTTPSGVNPSIKKPNLQPLSKKTFKVGDMYKITMPSGAHVRFKITKKVEGENWRDHSGTVLGVYGKLKDSEGNSEVAKQHRDSYTGVKKADYSEFTGRGEYPVEVGDSMDFKVWPDGKGFKWYLGKDNVRFKDGSVKDDISNYQGQAYWDDVEKLN